ncbi:MAG: TIGR00341 family protein [Campylobacterota bacterium]
MLGYKQVTIIVENKLDTGNLIQTIREHFKAHYKIEPELAEYKEQFTEAKNKIHFLYLSDSHVKEFLKNNFRNNLNIAILPNETSLDTIKKYSISKDIYEAIEDGMNDSLKSKDELLLCNGDVVFKKVSIGNVGTLGKSFEHSWFTNIKNFFNNLKNIKYTSVTIQTAEEKIIKTASSGILVLEDYTTVGLLPNVKESSFHDGRLNAFIIAPLSLFSYIYYLIVIFLYHRYSLTHLPKNIGFISTSKLKITSNQPFDFTLDSALLSAKEIDFEIVTTDINIHFGKLLKEFVSADKVAEKQVKDEVRIAYLPHGEINNLLIEGNIPLFKKASDEDIKETLISIKESSKLNNIFISLMIISTLLATVGIFQNSIPTVVGAMILAPLMSPIVSLAMGITRDAKGLINDSIKTLLFGIASALFFSAIVAVFMPLNVMTEQISSRLNPNVLDLLVAVFSGVAGAYAASKDQVAKSVAGVAIAVALVPPLAVSGIGIGWFDIEIIYGSFLLFLTNLFGVTVAASLTFIVLGFAPIHRAKKGLAYSTVLLAIVTIPLIISFYSLVLQSNDYAKLSGIEEITIGNKKVEINILSIKSSSSKKSIIELEVMSKSHLNDDEFQKIKEILEHNLQKQVTMEVIPKIVF